MDFGELLKRVSNLATIYWTVDYFLTSEPNLITMDQPSTSRADDLIEIEDLLATMQSPRDIIMRDEMRLTDNEIYGILSEDQVFLEDDWVDLAEEEVVTIAHEEVAMGEHEEHLEVHNTPWIPGNPAVMNVLPFTGNPAIKQEMAQTQELDYFNLIFNDDFYNLLLSCTNANGANIQRNCSPSARFRRWKPVTLEEFKTFLGLIFLMGIIKLNRLTDYWKRHYLFDLCFSNYMSRNRFFMILRALNVQEIPGNQSIYKVKSLIDVFNKTMENIYYPTKELTIDESMILWTGRLRFRQYLKNKVHKYGIKLYMLAANNGICMKIHVYAGSQDQIVGGKDHVKKVVRLLIENYTNCGHSLYIDNYYTSVDIAEELLKKKTYVTGTLQFNKKGNPKSVINAKLQPNESCIMHNNNNIIVTKWKDKREICFISSEHKSDYKETRNKYGNVAYKPNVQIKYNKYMRGVDRHDQMLSYYCAEHKTMRWYKKVIIHIFQINLINAFYLYNLDKDRKTSLYDFRLKIIENLLPNKHTSRRSSSTVRVHLPAHLPKRNGRTVRKRCRECYKNDKKRVDVLFGCPDCPDFPGLCLECFRAYHNY